MISLTYFLLKIYLYQWIICALIWIPKVNLAGRVFQPHGLGHFIGNDVHDVGGYLEGHRPRQEGKPLKFNNFVV